MESTVLARVVSCATPPAALVWGDTWSSPWLFCATIAGIGDLTIASLASPLASSAAC